MDKQASFEQWAIVELLGHRKLIGKVTHELIGTSEFIRIDPISPLTPIYANPHSVYAITVVSEEDAKRLQIPQWEPLARWQFTEPETVEEAFRSVDDNPF